jgi:hypothetical protein
MSFHSKSPRKELVRQAQCATIKTQIGICLKRN